VCVCSLRYPACNAHAPYCNMWPAPLYHIFPHKHDFRKKKLLNTKCPILMKLEFSRQIFEKFSNIKFHENPSNGTRVVRLFRRTDGQTWRIKYSLSAILRTRLKIYIVELVACWIRLKMNASHDAQNVVSETLQYSTTVT
jgi:hypothetical protein